MPNARSCPRCGLVLPGQGAATPAQPRVVEPALQRVILTEPPAQESYPQEPRVVEPPAVRRESPGNSVPDRSANPYQPYVQATAAASPLPQRGQSGPLGRSGQTGPLTARGQTGPLSSRSGTGPLTSRGSLELLAGESIAYQLGALYLTTKRVILLAPSVVRSAFVRDIDAVGTFTEKSSPWLLVFGFLLIALSGGAAYAAITPGLKNSIILLNTVPQQFMWLIALAFGLPGLYVVLRAALWVKRTLFVSVKGRPLITVSISDWGHKKLEGMDEFVNAFFQIKETQMELFNTGPLATGPLPPLD